MCVLVNEKHIASIGFVEFLSFMMILAVQLQVTPLSYLLPLNTDLQSADELSSLTHLLDLTALNKVRDLCKVSD